jgi:hypothetical protein
MGDLQSTDALVMQRVLSQQVFLVLEYHFGSS